MILPDHLSKKSPMAQAGVWAGIWLCGLALSALGLWWLRLLHGPVRIGWPVPGWSLSQSCLLAVAAPTVITSQVWSWREKGRRWTQQGRRVDSNFGRSLWVRGLKLPFFAVVTLIPLLTGQSRAHPDWPGLALCLPWLYAGYLALLWCGARLPEPTPDAPRLVIANAGTTRRGRERAARRIPFLVVANEREIVFRHSRGNRVGAFVFALVPLWVAVFSLMGALAGARYGASAVVLLPGYGFLALVLLSLTGPNETCLDLAQGTYRLRRYKPLPGRWAADWGAGVPFWEQQTSGPLGDILRLEIRLIRSKRSHVYLLHAVWRDPDRAPALLSILHSQAEAEALMRRVAEAAGVPAFAP